MNPIILIAGLLLINNGCFAQISNNKDELPGVIIVNGREMALNNLGYVIIYLKDGTAKKNCIIKEIKSNWIVFMKDKVLHDVMIDKIKKIEIEDGTIIICVDDKNRSFLKK